MGSDGLPQDLGVDADPDLHLKYRFSSMQICKTSARGGGRERIERRDREHEGTRERGWGEGTRV